MDREFRKIVILSVLLVFCAAGSARAHRFHVSKSQWRIIPEKGLLGATLNISGEDMGRLLNKVLSNDPAPPNESQRDKVFRVLKSTVRVKSGNDECVFKGLRQNARSGQYTIGMRFQCNQALGTLTIDFAFLAHMKAGHRHKARFNIDGKKKEHLLTSKEPVFIHSFAVKEQPVSANVPKEIDTSPEKRPRWQWLLVLIVCVLAGGVAWRKSRLEPK